MRALLAAAICVAATAQPAVAQPFKPTRFNQTMAVTLETGVREEVYAKCVTAGAHTSPRNPGCTISYPDRGRCTIYVIVPDAMDQSHRFERVGHEVLHCFYGAYHEHPDQ